MEQGGVEAAVEGGVPLTTEEVSPSWTVEHWGTAMWGTGAGVDWTEGSQ